MRRALMVAALVGAVGSAGTANALSFDTTAGQSFEQLVSVTPTSDNSLALLVSGMQSQFTSLSFELVGQSLTVDSKIVGGNRLASFSDVRNGAVALAAGTPYLVRIFGSTTAGLIGGHGTITITGINATSVTAVPEPGTWLMLLAGLGIVGSVVRRRST